MNVLSHVRIAGKLYTLILMAVLALVGLAVTNQHQTGKRHDRNRLALPAVLLLGFAPDFVLQ